MLCAFVERGFFVRRPWKLTIVSSYAIYKERGKYIYIFMLTEILGKLKSYCKLTEYLHMHNKYYPYVDVCYRCTYACVWTYKRTKLTEKQNLLSYGLNWSEVWTGSKDHFTYIFFLLLNFWEALHGAQAYTELCEHQNTVHLWTTIGFWDGGCVSYLVLFPRWQCQSPWGDSYCHGNTNLSDIYEWTCTPRNVWLLLKQFLLPISFIWVGTSQQKCPCSLP